MVKGGAEVGNLFGIVFDTPDLLVNLGKFIFVFEFLVEFWIDLCIVEIDTDMFFVFEDVVDVFIMELLLKCLEMNVIVWDII